MLVYLSVALRVKGGCQSIQRCCEQASLSTDKTCLYDERSFQDNSGPIQRSLLTKYFDESKNDGNPEDFALTNSKLRRICL